VKLDRQPRQHHTRPAIDPLFLSAAEAHGDRVVGVLLTGNLSDGVRGLIQIKRAGGLSIVQDPREAPFPSMPQTALVYDDVDLVFEVRSLPTLIERLVNGESVRGAVSINGARPVREADYIRPPWLAPRRSGLGSDNDVTSGPRRRAR
jgi:hypothetical protein